MELGSLLRYGTFVSGGSLLRYGTFSKVRLARVARDSRFTRLSSRFRLFSFDEFC